MFKMSDTETENFYEWYEKHECEKKTNSKKGECTLTFCFAPVASGCSIIIKCECGEEVDVTDF
jgi:hypothetical protein